MILPLIIYMFVGFIIGVTPLSTIEETHRWGILGCGIVWPYILYKRFRQ